MKLVVCTAIALAALGIVAGPALADSVEPAFGTFGKLTGATFGGTGIPNEPVAITTFSPDAGVTITVGLSATQRYGNPTPANDGAGTYVAGPGTSIEGPNSLEGALWNFNYYIDIDGATFDDYDVNLYYDFDPGTDTDEADLGIVDFDELLSGLSLDPAQFTHLEGSENLFFGWLESAALTGVTAPSWPSFNAAAAGEYSFKLEVEGAPVDELWHAAVNVNVTPEPASIAVFGLGLAGLAAARRRRKSKE